MDHATDDYIGDEWPVMSNGDQYDGFGLLESIRKNVNPFGNAWSVQHLIAEIEEQLHTKVIGVIVTKGSNNYGLHLELATQPDVVVRLSRADVNMPGFNGFPLEKQVLTMCFEAATYKLLQHEPKIRSSELLYFRVPVQTDRPACRPPPDNQGRGCMVFRLAEGEKKQMNWRTSSDSERHLVLTQAASIRASLFKFSVPHDFATEWLRKGLFDPIPLPEALPRISDTREFAIALFQSKIEVTIQQIGDMIGWPEDNEVVGPVAFAAKQSLLRLVPFILPEEPTKDGAPLLYRHVLEHGDFGIHNFTITRGCLVTSVFDWETACIVPALLADPEMAVTVDLTTDEDGLPLTRRVPKNSTETETARGKEWCAFYVEELFRQAPDFKTVIMAGKHARHLWFALKAWRGDDPESYFGKLGVWAEGLLKERSKDGEDHSP